MKLFIASNWGDTKNLQLNTVDVKNRLVSYFYLPPNKSDEKLKLFFKEGIFGDDVGKHKKAKELKEIKRKSLKQTEVIECKEVFDIFCDTRSKDYDSTLVHSILPKRKFIIGLAETIEKRLESEVFDVILFAGLHLAAVPLFFKSTYTVVINDFSDLTKGRSIEIAEGNKIAIVTSVLNKDSILPLYVEHLLNNKIEVSGILCLINEEDSNFLTVLDKKIPVESIFSKHRIDIQTIKSNKAGTLT